MPQGLEIASTKALNPIIVQGFYSNLLKIYNTYACTPFHIWNMDESGCNAFKSGLGKVLAKGGTKHVHAQILNAANWSIPHFYISKGKKKIERLSSIVWDWIYHGYVRKKIYDILFLPKVDGSFHSIIGRIGEIVSFQ